MDLIYKISGAYLYDNQLNHDYLFFLTEIRENKLKEIGIWEN